MNCSLTPLARRWQGAIALAMLTVVSTLAVADPPPCALQIENRRLPLSVKLSDGREVIMYRILPHLADVGAAVVYGYDGPKDKLKATSLVGFALQRLDNGPRRFVAVCPVQGEVDPADPAPALANCERQYYRRHDGQWASLSKAAAGALLDLASPGATPPATAEDRYRHLLGAELACSRNDTATAITLFERAAAGPAPTDEAQRALALDGVYRAAMLRVGKLVGDKKRLSRRGLRELTEMMSAVSQARCRLVDRAFPERVYGGNPGRAYVAVGYNKPGFVDLEFDVGVDGTPGDLTVVAQKPASGLYEKASRDQVSTARFMSACAAGEPVVAEGFAYRISWFVGGSAGAPAVWVTP